jgi:2-iminobutanoate/2-iminopropanoate deaminase
LSHRANRERDDIPGAGCTVLWTWRHQFRIIDNQGRGDSPHHGSEAGMAKTYLKRPAAQARAYSQAVVSEGGRVVWLAGQVAAEDASGKSLAGDFDGQVREVFSRLGKTLAEAGGVLGDMVTMTVFITDPRLGDRFTELRKAIFGDDFPASALITVAGLARPELLVEVQGIAVIG